ncbi:molybdenum cofactor biosynthesis protein MoaE [Pacificimonas sp. WHA3]|uniref:Molybdenum cofactor biosynthesis protein MoaE n=1 Tax=Pacificimonas pallii TaxID=2827236 RepID=A0ABS6SCL5_9SPHN|nr:molybdenum cofactor biosynthesis protein MoaE [Pacificimonas pallii]MBV7256162.1 molybdenum cofactor biosynthesis protein MoaE [Pacificimonas pallii]
MIDTRVQSAPFDVAAETANLTAGRGDIGAVVSFTGLVRGDAGDTLTLEHYPGMTERMLANIAAEAETRWGLSGGLVIHRYGVLPVGAPIVLVLTASRHRADAFQAAEFLMDWLKVKAPFWKKDANGWVEAQGSDDDAASRWNN